MTTKPTPATVQQLTEAAADLRQLTGLYIGVSGNRVTIPSLSHMAAVRLAQRIRNGDHCENCHGGDAA